MDNSNRNITPEEVVKVYKNHKTDITLEEAKGILAYMDNMIDHVKRQLGDDKMIGIDTNSEGNIWD